MTDDIPTMIFDLGSYKIRAGLATDESPRFIIPSAFPSGAHDFPIGKEIPPSCTPSFAITDGEVEDQDRINFLFASIFDNFFPSDKPEPVDLRIVLTNPPYASKKHMSYIAQATFELLDADSLIMKPPALYSLIQFSLPTCICLDVGYDVTHIVPIQHNFVCAPAVMKSFAAGSALDLFTSADQFGVYNVKTWQEMEQARKKKEEFAFSSLDFEKDLDDENPYPVTCGELLFNPSLFEAATPEDKEPDERISTLMEEPSLAEFIKKSIETCDLQNRGTLWNNIIISGGSSKMKGFRERLKADLEEIAPSEAKVTLRFPEDPILAPWLGEKLSINFSKSEPWLNRSEYEEDPDAVFHKFVQYGLADPNKTEEKK
ncbi:hypothetical protein M9Y10_028011 [Tritrichomonas musculus]|uniref:Actin family protein n=1 Tax=Tritrichomonas musculus TaxID=1915356 RepID=A0ABR2KI76_9EUKA